MMLRTVTELSGHVTGHQCGMRLTCHRQSSHSLIHDHTHFIMISKLRRQYNLVQFSPICGGWWVSELTTQSDQAWPPPAPATTHPPARPGEPEFIINNYSNRWTENLPPANSHSLSAIPSVINNFHLQFLDFALHSVVWCGALERSA